MANCNGCLKEDVNGFCSACETKLFDRSKVNTQLTFNWDDIVDRITGQPAGFSISGVQPKGFIGRDKKKLLVPNRDIDPIAIGSMYIIKPSLNSRLTLHTDSPANEHLTMVMANQLFKINTARCGLVYFTNGEPAYLTRRFDRDKDGNPLNQEDFVSVLKATKSDTDGGLYKYNSFTYEDVGNVLGPANQIDFISILIFNFLSGNGDVHLKNLSLLESPDGDMLLSPSYDLMNTKLHTNDAQTALNLFIEKERKLDLMNSTYDYKIADFIELGKRIGVRDKMLIAIEKEFSDVKDKMVAFVDKSFLSDDAKRKYKKVVEQNHHQLFSYS